MLSPAAAKPTFWMVAVVFFYYRRSRFEKDSVTNDAALPYRPLFVSGGGRVATTVVPGGKKWDDWTSTGVVSETWCNTPAWRTLLLLVPSIRGVAKVSRRCTKLCQVSKDTFRSVADSADTCKFFRWDILLCLSKLNKQFIKKKNCALYIQHQLLEHPVRYYCI